MTENLTKMSEDELFNRNFDEPSIGDYVGIPNGLYTVRIEAVNIQQRREDFYNNSIKTKTDNVFKEAKENNWDEQKRQAAIDKTIRSEATHEFKWSCLILDDEEGEDDDKRKKTTVRGQKVYPTANYAKSKSPKAKIVQYIKQFEGKDAELSNPAIVKTWVGKYTNVQIEQSPSGYPKAKFVNAFLKGAKLELAEKMYAETQKYLESLQNDEAKASFSSNIEFTNIALIKEKDMVDPNPTFDVMKVNKDPNMKEEKAMTKGKLQATCDRIKNIIQRESKRTNKNVTEEKLKQICNYYDPKEIKEAIQKLYDDNIIYAPKPGEYLVVE